jgi:dienelactone hydrolase
VVIYGPPGDSILARRPNRNALEQVRPPADTIVASGRALVIPIWDGSYETALPQPRDINEMLDRGRRSSLSWYRQLSTTLDYLETRPDLDMRRVGFMGFSFGAAFVGPIMLATEGRLKTGVLISGGVVPAPGIHPMLDAVNYAPRIKVPVLMAGGRYDHLFLYEQSQKRLFSLLGTPPQQKQLKVYDVGHFAFPSNSIAMDISDWFDKYLGPVR